MTRKDFEERKERRRERLLERAEKAARKAADAQSATRQLMGAIPPGQPLLVGHHSERRHRAALRKIDRGMQKAVDERAKADELRARAAAVGTGGISSDDPTAIEQLETKLRALENHRELRKAINAAWRKHGRPTPDDVAGWDRVNAVVQLRPDDLRRLRMELASRSWDPDKTPFPAYSLTNIGARIRDAKRRLAELQRAEEAVPRDIDHGVCRVVESVEENRIQLFFPGKPEAAVRDRLKRHGFRWSPASGAWQRHLNDAGRYAAKAVVDALRESKAVASRIEATYEKLKSPPPGWPEGGGAS